MSDREGEKERERDWETHLANLCNSPDAQLSLNATLLVISHVFPIDLTVLIILPFI